MGILMADSEAIRRRLARVEGHVRSIASMIEDGRSTADVLPQLTAVMAAIGRVAELVVEREAEECLDELGRDRICEACGHEHQHERGRERVDELHVAVRQLARLPRPSAGRRPAADD
jgi:DNA-binding FrmR family transcriptional regulator